MSTSSPRSNGAPRGGRAAWRDCPHVWPFNDQPLVTRPAVPKHDKSSRPKGASVTRTVDVVLPIISRSPAHGGISSLLTSSPRTRRARRRIPPRQRFTFPNFVTVRAFRAIDPASGTVASRATKIAASVRYASEFPGTCRARTGDLRSAAHQGVGCYSSKRPPDRVCDTARAVGRVQRAAARSCARMSHRAVLGHAANSIRAGCKGSTGTRQPAVAL